MKLYRFAKILKPNSRTLCNFSGKDNLKMNWTQTPQSSIDQKLEHLGNTMMDRLGNKMDCIRRELKEDFKFALDMESRRLSEKIESTRTELSGIIKSTRIGLRSDIQVLKDRVSLTWICIGFVSTIIVSVTGWIAFINETKHRFGSRPASGELNFDRILELAHLLVDPNKRTPGWTGEKSEPLPPTNQTTQ